MREILFRGKVIESTVKEAGEWVYGHLVVRKDHDDEPEQCFICKEGHRFIRCLNKMPCTYKVDPETIGQYTGLTDQNGKRIFEGDIVRATYRGNYVRCAFEVIFRDCRFALLKNGVLVEMHDGYGIEVIGNIHDNPELLGGET